MVGQVVVAVVAVHCFPLFSNQSEICICLFSVVLFQQWVLPFCTCCLSFPLPVSTSKYEPKSRGFLLIPSATLIYFPFNSINCISLYTPSHRRRPARYSTQQRDMKIDDLIACSCRCHLFSFANREKATGQIPALQTTLWEEEKEGGKRGL